MGIWRVTASECRDGREENVERQPAIHTCIQETTFRTVRNAYKTVRNAYMTVGGAYTTVSNAYKTVRNASFGTVGKSMSSDNLPSTHVFMR